MTKPNFGERCKAHLKVRATKDAMDEAQRALDKAEDEWHRACVEADRLDDLARSEPWAPTIPGL